MFLVGLSYHFARSEGIYYAHEPYVIIWWFLTQLASLDLHLLEMIRNRCIPLFLVILLFKEHIYIHISIHI